MLIETLKANLSHIHSGKVRETFEIPDHPDLLLQLVTNRVSTHNVLHQSTIPFKGSVLTALTVYWLRDVFSDTPNHLVASGRQIYAYLPHEVKVTCPDLHLQAMVVKRLQMIPRELIIRAYLVGAGSLYKAYIAGRDPYDLRLPPELPIMHRFEPPIFTPTDKSERDNPLPHWWVEMQFSNAVNTFRKAFDRAAAHLHERGIVLLDSKGECGVGGILADELFTPDSSRFADTGKVEAGKDPPWLDKELVRQAAETIWDGGNRFPLILPQTVIDKTSLTYVDILERITGHDLDAWCGNEMFDFQLS